jgi:hypothetical protein
VQYVYVSLPREAAVQPGDTITIEGLASEHPVLHTADGAAAAAAGTRTAGGGGATAADAAKPASTGGSSGSTGASSSTRSRLQGHYIDTIGSVIFMQKQPQPQPQQPSQQQDEAPPPAFKYVAHTEKQLCFDNAE